MATCTDSQLVPRVAQLLVSQGAPGYARLARGKEAIVRAYLATPTTCTLSNKQSITPVSARLNLSYSTTAPPPAQLLNNDPLTGKLGATPLAYSTSDPYFVVPATYLTASSGTPPPKFDVTFTLGLTYTRNSSTQQFTTVTGATTALATVDQQTKAIRILVVPMGDRSSGSVQWTAAAETALDNVLANAGRALPVPSGVTKELSPTTPTTAGIRYRVSGDLLDVRALGLYKTSSNVTKFCANAATWTTTQPGATGAFAGKTLKTELQDRLDNYNLYNSPPADLVLGVIDGTIAWKSTEGITGGCDDGRAATPDPIAKTPGELAWVRVDTGTSPTPLQMELAHTLGIVDPSIRSTFHGLEVQTDAAAPDKVYNVLQRKVVMAGAATGVVNANDHSIMNYDTTSIPYTKDNTLALARDWDDALCDLGGSESNAVAPALPFASCTISTAVGTDIGVAAGAQLDMFHIDGHLSPEGLVTVNDANTAAGDGEFGIGSSGSPLHLLLCVGPCESAGGNTRDIPLSLSGQAPIDADHVGPAGPTAPDEFSALVSLQSFTCAELRLSGVTKFSSCESDPDPEIRNTSITGAVLRSFTPDICCNGRAIAFDGTNLYVTTAGGATAHNIYKLSTTGNVLGSVETGTTIGALAFNGGRLYGGNYEDTGEVYDINPSNGEKSPLFTFNDDSCNRFIDGLEFLPGTENRFAISGDICQTVYLKKMDGTPATPSSFSAAVFPSGNSGITTDGASGLWLAILNTESVTAGTILKHVDLAGNTIGEPINIVGYEAEDLAYDNVTFAPDCAVWMNQATGSAPLIRAVSVPCGGGGSGGDDAIGVWTQNAEFVTLFAVCGAQADATNPATEKFSLGTYVPDANSQTIVPFTDDRYCSNATIISEASNGWDSTGLTAAQGSADVSPPSQAPRVNIAAPYNGAKFRLGDNIHYEGYATDAEDGEIVDSLRWFDNGSPIPGSSGKTSFDLKVPSTAALGNHVIRLEASDANAEHTVFTSVTIQIKPRVCSSSSGCP
jgi:hypothetical protein